jgi:hypothetical protein
MTTTYHDPDESPFELLSLHSVQPGEYDDAGWIVALRVPDSETLRAVLDRWGP